MSPELPEVRALQHSEIEDAIAMLTLSFCADPITRVLMPTADRYLDRFPGMSRSLIQSAIEQGSAFVSDQQKGAALWLPPGIQMDDAAVTGALLEGAPPEVLSSGALQALADVEEFHPTEPYWYLAIMGVDPLFQRKGLGSAMLRTQLEVIDATPAPVFLETSKPSTVALYERHGFKALGQLGPEGADWSLVPMLRDAR